MEQLNISAGWCQITHIHSLSQRWCADHFPTFIPKNRWPPNSPDLCPLDYSLWNEVPAGMDWNIITKINDIKRSVKEKILHSVFDFTVQLRLIQKNGGNCIR